MKREINMKKTLLFSAMVFAALALCSCGSAETPSASGPAYAPAAPSAPVDEIAERLNPTAAYVCKTDEYWSVIRFDPSSKLVEGVDGPPSSDNLIFFKGTYSLEGRGLTISYQFLHESSHSTYQTSYSVRFLTDGISLTPLGYVDGIFQDGTAGTKDFTLSSDWTASSLHELCALAEHDYNHGEDEQTDQTYNNGENEQDDPLHVSEKFQSLIAEPKVWTYTRNGDTIHLAFLDSEIFLAYRCKEDNSPVYGFYGNYGISGRELSLFYIISSHPENMPIDTYTFAVGETTFSLWHSWGDYAPLGDKQRQGRLFRPDDTLTYSDLLKAVKATFEKEGDA